MIGADSVISTDFVKFIKYKYWEVSGMYERMMDEVRIEKFEAYLIHEEKSEATCEKYLRDVRRFRKFAGERAVSKELVMDFKRELVEQGYAVRSINSMLASVNCFLNYFGWNDCRVKNLRLQRQTYCHESKELTKLEYIRLLRASQNNERMNLILQTICSTGIRVSELSYFTVEAVRSGEIIVNCKNKTRTILVPGKLRSRLLHYAGKAHITEGVIFVNRRGKPLDRSFVWRYMKRLCEKADVKGTKVFPHNLRKLFARTFYSIERDIAKLADILGHSSINTTRIYIMTTGEEHRQKIERLGLIL